MDETTLNIFIGLKIHDDVLIEDFRLEDNEVNVKYFKLESFLYKNHQNSE